MHFSKPSRLLKLASLLGLTLDYTRESGILNVARNRKDKDDDIREYYGALYRAWGPQHWWPAETAFEVIVGAYLTQNTAWTNVERALANLRAAELLTVEGIRGVKLARLERLIRPSGYFRQKARRLKTFVAHLDKEYGGSLDRLFSQPTDKLREEILGLNGVGPETADSILLYAGNHAVFVVDAYTRRIFERHGILPEKADYEEIRELFQHALAPVARELEGVPSGSAPLLESGVRGAAHPPSAMSTAQRTALVQVYNEMHGLIVGVGKNYCRKAKAACDECPLRPFLPAGHGDHRIRPGKVERKSG
jgi:endonuclease III related protein